MWRAHTSAWWPSAAILALAVITGGCGGTGSGQPTAPPTSANPVPPASPSIVLPVPSPSPESSSSAAMQAAVQAAMHDAAQRPGVASGDMHVQQVEARQWPDSSLGCPREGVMYSQIVTPGYLVVISAAGTQLEYHADSRGQVVLCREV